MPQVPLATRLQFYGVNSADQKPADLQVPANQEMVLNANDPKLSRQVVKLVPKTIDDLKKWIGTPNAGFAHVQAATASTLARPALANSNRLATLAQLHPVLQAVLPVHNKYTPSEDIALRQLAAAYVFGHSETVNAAQLPALNKWISVIDPHLILIIFNDIHVASGATLVVNHNVLFANHITIDKGGKIQMKITKSKIDCAGIKGA